MSSFLGFLVAAFFRDTFDVSSATSCLCGVAPRQKKHPCGCFQGQGASEFVRFVLKPYSIQRKIGLWLARFLYRKSPWVPFFTLRNLEVFASPVESRLVLASITSSTKRNFRGEELLGAGASVDAKDNRGPWPQSAPFQRCLRNMTLRNMAQGVICEESCYKMCPAMTCLRDQWYSYLTRSYIADVWKYLRLVCIQDSGL